ncbi:MAG TPA: tetratricopeptide repeat protein [Actinomycetota bacterium]|nr:tetratricopeptide repeat protein [Actinomycetota bacterium]
MSDSGGILVVDARIRRSGRADATHRRIATLGSDEQRLKPYVPRLVVEWARDAPEDRHRRVEGSLAFVDISGFTSMTERLARKGKVGAEEVNDVLDVCFTNLLSVAYDFDGGVIKWGGDAVLLLFTGEDHAPRACRAAVGMRDALRRLRRFQTSAGNVALRMSVGIHSGAFDFFLIGGSHRELIITGPAASRTVAMESTATAGEIAISSATAALLPANAVGKPKGEALLLRREPDADVVRAGPVSVADDEIAPFVPIDTRTHLLTGGGDTEHRRITVAFIQYKGTDAPLDAGRYDEAADALERLILTVQDAAEAHGVSFHDTDIDADGGKVLLVAGAPRASGNDEERMLRAVRRIVEAGTDLPIRIGVNAGGVFVGDFGPPYRRSYAMKGDAVNLAARIMGKADVGQILATDDVLSRSGTKFDARPMTPFMVKGKKRPIQAYDIGPIVASERPKAEKSAPLIGRERELALLREALETSRTTHGRVVDLVAEPGMGKSRLLEELERSSEDAPVLRVICDPYEASTPYHPFRALLRDALGIPQDLGSHEGGEILIQAAMRLAPEIQPWLPLIAVPFDVDVPPSLESEQLELEFKKARLEDATATLLRAALPGPALLIFEDVHWMDESSSDLLGRLVSQVDDTRWLICDTRRDESSGFAPQRGPSTTLIELPPLSPTDAAELAAMSGDAEMLDPHALSVLAERSGGNPLFLRELVAASQNIDVGEVLPDSVEALLAARIDRLTAPDRALLRSASVLGASFSIDLLEQTLDDRTASIRDPATWTRLAEYIVASDDELRFRHALIRDAAYEGLPYRRRRELHEKVGATLERSSGDVEDLSELLSMHFFHAHDFDKAWTYCRLAGDRARSKFANVEAADFYRRAIQSARSLGTVPEIDVADVFRSLGDVSDRAGRYDEAARAYASARSLVAGDALAEAHLLLKEGVIRDRSGRYSLALGWYRRGLTKLDGIDGDPRAEAARAQLAVWYAAARRQQGRLKEAIKWCLIAIDHARAGDDKDALAHAYRLLDWVYTELGHPERVDYRGLALPLYEELGDLGGQADILNQLGMDAYFEGRWTEAIDLYRRVEEASEKIGDAVTAAHGTNNIAEILSDQGRLEEAEPLFQRAFRVWRASRFSLGIPFAMSNLGRLAARAGRFEEAHARLSEAAAGFRAIGAEGQALEAEARIAEAMLLEGRHAEALESATSTLQRANALKGLVILRAMLHRLRGWALIASERLAEARVALEESLRLARSVDADFEIAQTLLALARVEEDSEHAVRDQHEKEAHAILDKLGVATPQAVVPDRGGVVLGESNSRA